MYLINILFERGIMPELRYIYSSRTDYFESLEEAASKLIKFFPDTLTAAEDMLLREYLKAHLVKTESGQYTYDESWPVRWAYIASGKIAPAEKLPGIPRSFLTYYIFYLRRNAIYLIPLSHL